MAVETVSVLYQDHHLLVVNKPAGIVIHPTYKHADGTFWDALLVYLAQQGRDDWLPPELPDEPAWAGAPLHIQDMLRANRIERQWKEDGLLPRPCLLHRLDKDTSGVVALARTERARRHIIRQFHAHTVVKRYLAVVQKGSPAWAYPLKTFTVTRGEVGGDELTHDLPPALHLHDELELDGPLQRDPDDRRRSIVGPTGQEARTRVKVLAIAEEQGFALLEALPITGRTHQIRAHLAALGYAIVGDQMYAPAAASGTPQAALKRQFLHAYSLELRRYPDNLPGTFVAPLADELSAWLTTYFPSAFGAIHADHTVST